MKNLCTYLLLNKVSCNTDITNNFEMKDLMLPSISFLAIFGFTCFVSIIIYNNSFEQSKELKSDILKKSNESLDILKESNELNQAVLVENTKKILKSDNLSDKLVKLNCDNYLNSVNNVKSSLVNGMFPHMRSIIIDNMNNEKLKYESLLSLKNKISNVNAIQNVIDYNFFVNRSVFNEYVGINGYLKDFKVGSKEAFINPLEFTDSISDKLIEIETYINVGNVVRDKVKNQEISKNYMFFFQNQKTISENEILKKNIFKLFNETHLEEAQFYMLNHMGIAVNYVIDHDLLPLTYA